MEFKVPESVNNDFNGYRWLINVYHKIKNLTFDEVVFNFSKTSWFAANLLAVFGAILNRIENEINEIKLIRIQDQLDILFRRNDFLSYYGSAPLQDFYSTTVKYRKFKTSEEQYFKNYLDQQLLSKKSFPEMSTLLRKKINESIFEIFNNASIHGKCNEVFSCGQYFPKKDILDFTVVDLGRTIKRNVSDFLNKSIAGVESIQWAVSEGNTTKVGSIPGGLGLKLIREFLEKNRGKIQIISADGYWEQNADNIIDSRFKNEFPGTIVNLEFNIADKSYYYLASELKPDDIF